MKSKSIKGGDSISRFVDFSLVNVQSLCYSFVACVCLCLVVSVLSFMANLDLVVSLNQLQVFASFLIAYFSDESSFPSWPALLVAELVCFGVLTKYICVLSILHWFIKVLLQKESQLQLVWIYLSAQVLLSFICLVNYSDLFCSSRFSRLQAEVKMGSAGEKIELEFDEEIPFSSSQAAIKIDSLHYEAPHIASARSYRPLRVLRKMYQISLLRSIYFVIIKAKINLLLPFGPLAILLHYATGNHVIIVFKLSPYAPFWYFLQGCWIQTILFFSFQWCLSLCFMYNLMFQALVFFFSLLGITPLAERLGYATE